jgi:hypothetical protein
MLASIKASGDAHVCISGRTSISPGGYIGIESAVWLPVLPGGGDDDREQDRGSWAKLDRYGGTLE